MLYITGDLHGDIERFEAKAMKKIKKRDTLLVCGDFGFVWDDSAQERKRLQKLSRRRHSILFVEGSHDNLELLEKYPLEEFCGGQVRRIACNIRWLQRGYVFRLESKNIFAFGGGECVDIDSSIQRDWAKRQLPTIAEMQRGLDNLEKTRFVVDYIITHDCGDKMKSFLEMHSTYANHLNAYLNDISLKCQYKGWHFGCYHLDKRIPPVTTAVFEQVHPLP